MIDMTDADKLWLRNTVDSWGNDHALDIARIAFWYGYNRGLDEATKVCPTICTEYMSSQGWETRDPANALEECAEKIRALATP
jgi:hypothetical protein